MQKPRPSKTVQFIALLLLVAATATIFGCRNKQAAEQAAEPAPAGTTQAQPRNSSAAQPLSKQPAVNNKQQAMAALMALPELKAWSSQIANASGGQAHGALIEYDARPKIVGGKRYFQLSFVENSRDAAQRWESFLVAESGDAILIEDNAADRTMTLAQWRATEQPMQRTGVH